MRLRLWKFETVKTLLIRQSTPWWDFLDLSRKSHPKTKRILFFNTRQGFFDASQDFRLILPRWVFLNMSTLQLYFIDRDLYNKDLHVHAYFFYWRACVYDHFSLFICWVICVCCCFLFIFTLFAFVRLFVFTQYGNHFVSNKSELQPMVE
jgi:hypothetical protein